MNDLSDQVASKAKRAVEQLKDHSDETLDYSEASLSAVETMLLDASQYSLQMGAKQIDGFVRIIGSYVLEVARNQFGGIYYWHRDLDQPILVVGEPEYKVALMTFDRVRGKLFGEDENIPDLYRSFAQSVRSASSGTDVLHE